MPHDLLTTAQVAALLNVTPARIRQLRLSLEVGQQIGRDLFYTPGDIEKLRNRCTTMGHPKRKR